MGESLIRKLKTSSKFQTLRVPEGFDQNVRVTGPDGKVVEPGTSPDVVEDAGFDLIARFTKAEKSLADKKQAKGDPLAPLAEHVATVAREMRGGDGGSPTVSADVAAALLAVDTTTRDMILRRAGNPPEFESLRGGGLPPVPRAKQLDDAFGQAGGRARVREEEAQLAEENSVTSLPMQFRPSSVSALPDKKTKSGKLVRSSERYKEFKIDDQSPLDVPGPRTLAEQARAAGKRNVPDPATQELTKKQKIALEQIAGDQISQVKAIEKKQLEPRVTEVLPPDLHPLIVRTESQPTRKPSVGQARVLEAAEQADRSMDELARVAQVKPGTVRRLLESGLLDYAGKMEEVDSDQFLTIGADPNYWKPSDRRTAGRPTVDRTLEYRNKSQADRILQRLYELTAPQTALTEQGAPVHLNADNTSTVDLDALIPWWRQRFPDMDDKGKLVYPKRLPTAEFVTGQLIGRLGVTEPGAFNRFLPLIQRSIDAAPDLPDPNVESRGRTAHQFAQLPSLPSPSFQDIMRQAVRQRTAKTPVYGPTAADFHLRYPIYGPRQVALPDVEAPERHPFKEAAEPTARPPLEERLQQVRKSQQSAETPEQQPAPPAKPAAESLEERLKRVRKSAQPGSGDQASIYMMPDNSPMRALLA